MRGLFDTVREFVEKFSALSASSCGGPLPKGAVGRDSSGGIFALHPLTAGVDPEAVHHTHHAVRLLHAGQTEESLQELHDARQIAPQSHEACSNLGCAYHMSGDDNAALYWYRQAQCFAPHDETAVLALAMLEQRRGQVMEAQKLLVKYLQEVDPSHIGALRQLGHLHQHEKRWSQAAGCFHRLISLEPSNAEWQAELQVCLDQVPLKNERGEVVKGGNIGVFARAFSFAEPILRSAELDSLEASKRPMSKHFDAEQRPGIEAQVHVADRGRDLTRSQFNEARARESSVGAATQSEEWALAQSFRMAGNGEEDRLPKQLRVLDRNVVASVGTVVEQLNRGSLQCPEGLIAVYSNSGQAYFLLYRADKKDVAYAAFKQALEQASVATSTKLDEAFRLRGSGRSDAALAVYRNVLLGDPRSWEALLGVVDCQCDLGDFDAALEACKQLLLSRHDDAEANLRMAEVLLAGGRRVELVDPYLRLLQDLRSSLRITLQHRFLCALAEAALTRDDYAEALTSAAEAVRIDSSARSLAILGHARLRVAEYPGALRALGAAHEILAGSQSLEARRLRASVHMLTSQAHERLRQYPQALSQAQAALDIRPSYSDARVVRAMALTQSGRGAEADAELVAVLQREPQHAGARLQRGYLQLLQSDFRAAASSLEAVITGSCASASLLGAAKVYMALALENLPDQSSKRRSEKVLREGIALHRNLQHVWQDIEKNLAQQPVAAVQRLRGICDLDLSSPQAQQLLQMLAQAMGRADILTAAANQATPQHQRVRGPSVPPNRWAPTSPADVVVATGAAAPGSAAPGAPGSGAIRASSPQRYRSVSPGPSWNAVGSNMQRAGSVIVRPSDGSGRGRSMSPGAQRCGSMYVAGAAGAAGGAAAAAGARQRATSRELQEPAARGRALSPSGGGRADAITLGWDEVIAPHQLVFGPQLGAGGSASVFRGTWNGMEVAIKKITGVAHLEEMKKEINALRRLRHPRLVRFIGACIQPPQLLVVTEFMSNGSLHDRLFGRMKDPALTQAQRWNICTQMAEGLAFLHANRVVHRDLKSMNILLDSADNAKICDFGLAQQMEATHLARKTQGEGGSPRYMAPECYEASYGKLTEKVDIWSMGCIVIELFGNQLPYDDCKTMAQLSARILVERRPPDIPPIVPAPLAEVCKRCLFFDERRRINAGDLHAELGKVRRLFRV